MMDLIASFLLAFVFGHLLVSTYKPGNKLEGADVPLVVIYLIFIIFAVCNIVTSILGL